MVSALLSFVSNAETTALLIGFNESAVLFTLSICKLFFKSSRVLAPVPPRATGTSPTIFSAATPFAK